MKQPETEHGATLTRRVVLTGGAGIALTLLIPQPAPACAGKGHAAVASTPDGGGQSELYVFRSADPTRTVLAATWTALSDHGCRLRVHAGEKTWAVEIPAGRSSSTFAYEAECQFFAGDIVDRVVGHDVRIKAAVIEVPTDMISTSGSSQVWAERISHQGSRLRMGSPFLSAIIARNLLAAKLYHASSPAEDGAELTRFVADAVSANARASGYKGNAVPYGRRVASAIVPDALRFDPHLPVGFTFAAQNGRHPDDPAQSVVDTALNGTLAPESHPPRRPLDAHFPYFPQSSARA